MFKNFFIGIFCLILLMGWGCEEKKESTLIVGTSADNPPYMFYKDGEVVGFEKDIIDAIAKELQLKVEIKDLSFDSIIGALQAKRIDLAISAITVTPERQKQVDFTKPYVRLATAIVINKKSHVKSVKDLKGLNVGAQAGSVHEQYAKEELQKKEGVLSVKSLVKIPDLIQDLKSKRIQAIVLGETEASYIAKHHHDLKIIKLSNEESFAIALPKGSALLPKLNELIEKWTKDGKLKAMFDKWAVPHS